LAAHVHFPQGHVLAEHVLTNLRTQAWVACTPRKDGLPIVTKE
jgi:hypothetical protein